jgi:hypothetical protein
MSEIMTIKPRLHFIFPNDSKFGAPKFIRWHSTQKCITSIQSINKYVLVKNMSNEKLIFPNINKQ